MEIPIVQLCSSHGLTKFLEPVPRLLGKDLLTQVTVKDMLTKWGKLPRGPVMAMVQWLCFELGLVKWREKDQIECPGWDDWDRKMTSGRMRQICTILEGWLEEANSQTTSKEEFWQNKILKTFCGAEIITLENVLAEEARQKAKIIELEAEEARQKAEEKKKVDEPVSQSVVSAEEKPALIQQAKELDELLARIANDKWVFDTVKAGHIRARIRIGLQIKEGCSDYIVRYLAKLCKKSGSWVYVLSQFHDLHHKLETLQESGRLLREDARHLSTIPTDNQMTAYADMQIAHHGVDKALAKLVHNRGIPLMTRAKELQDRIEHGIEYGVGDRATVLSHIAKLCGQSTDWVKSVISLTTNLHPRLQRKLCLYRTIEDEVAFRLSQIRDQDWQLEAYTTLRRQKRTGRIHLLDMERFLESHSAQAIG